MTAESGGEVRALLYTRQMHGLGSACGFQGVKRPLSKVGKLLPTQGDPLFSHRGTIECLRCERLVVVEKPSSVSVRRLLAARTRLLAGLLALTAASSVGVAVSWPGRGIAVGWRGAVPVALAACVLVLSAVTLSVLSSAADRSLRCTVEAGLTGDHPECWHLAEHVGPVQWTSAATRIAESGTSSPGTGMSAGA